MSLQSLFSRFRQLHFILRIVIGLLFFGVFYFLWRERFVVTRQFLAPEEMLFSNTQPWGILLRLKESQKGYTNRQFSAITLSAPHTNTDPRTQDEIADLHELVRLRTHDVIARIDRERFDVRKLTMADKTLRSLLRDGAHPLSDELIDAVLYDFDAYVLHFKRIHDRVRPTILDPSLPHAFPVPKHPSYPSGHSSQAHLIAEILSIFQPKQREAFFADAWRVATDREIAGFHYRSDTVAGRILAQQYFALLMESDDFRRDLAAAKSEWE